MDYRVLHAVSHWASGSGSFHTSFGRSMDWNTGGVVLREANGDAFCVTCAAFKVGFFVQRTGWIESDVHWGYGIFGF